MCICGVCVVSDMCVHLWMCGMVWCVSACTVNEEVHTYARMHMYAFVYL